MGFPRSTAALTALILSQWLLVAGCRGERAALLRGQAYYEENQYERALSIWRSLERQEADLTPSEFARYAYLRGMTDYRLGFHPDARHWLGLAKVAEQQRSGSLDGAWLSRLDAALSDLDRQSLGVAARSADSVQSIEAPGLGAPPPSPSAAPPGAGPTPSP